VYPLIAGGLLAVFIEWIVIASKGSTSEMQRRSATN
jgi:hypothetical protein